MRIELHIGPHPSGTRRLQSVLASKRNQLLRKGVLFPRSPGVEDHARLFMAVTEADRLDPLRCDHALQDPARQAALRDELAQALRREVERAEPEVLILSSAHLGTSLWRISEMERLRDFLSGFGSEVRVTAHVAEQSRMLCESYARQLRMGRAIPLDRDLKFAAKDRWWDACIAAMPAIAPAAGIFEETQGPPFWLDYTALVDCWGSVFGPASVQLRGYDANLFDGPTVTEEIRAAFGIEQTIGKAEDQTPQQPDSAASLARFRLFNALVLKLLAPGQRKLPHALWRQLLSEIAVPGPPPDDGGLSALSRRFAEDNTVLARRFPVLGAALDPPAMGPDWREADPGQGFRASQYLLAFMWRIDHAGSTPAASEDMDLTTKPDVASMSDSARQLMTPQAVRHYIGLRTSRFAPHDRIGNLLEDLPVEPYAPAPARLSSPGRGGTVIIACMKDEAPYLLEWIAHHRAIGVGHFVIYSNDCSDGTQEMLDRLSELGVSDHRRNDDWSGPSPQQHALDRALTDPVVREADWFAHIDVDEFINVRTGDGTLDALRAAVPDATNVAMTWRLFGHNGVHRLQDRLVTVQFDRCAPRHCPKPHTAWGFKTLTRNIGAYRKISCHRPNKLVPGAEERVKWVNGSGADMTQEVLRSGWRNSRRSIGYDLVQLNHYALRSLDSFLVKRQRGRALHVDRSIGLNYWVRMDWSYHRDLTIQRNTARLRAEYDRLMQDERLRALHRAGLDWHRDRAETLRATPEFAALAEQVQSVQLSEVERAAYAMAVDTES
ncbi:glycosyltransferase family 2 protein [Sulfitobacter sp. D35]|uniref:glycosyltransferase family 2 protein n=1 Tax=Sulfitobacter sp. D35 TaxID=3083252 RepID=UPI00297006C1|nr:glycosyltransferase family 2 protein [Sulfitobacter sp. D35]MDW4497513.1 glycosyltransferase family 2 protein [Sulfitobacter sp. D35]